MRNHPRFFLLLLMLLTLVAVYVDLPVIPFAGKKISVAPLKRTISIPQALPFKKGLDLQGGTSITLRADMKGIAESERAAALESVRTVLERRVNLFGVSEPVIQTVSTNGDYRIIVDLPGVDISQTKSLIGTTAQLSFWEQGPAASVAAMPTNTASYPLGILQLLGTTARKTDLTGKDLSGTTTSFDPSTGQPQVQLTFTSDGTRKFADITKRNIGKVVAIVLDNAVIEAPRVNQVILGGNAVITGQFTTNTAKALAIELQAGQLPVPLTTLQSQTIGASLGQGALQNSLFAGAIGFFIVVIFMVALYGRLGFIASGALFLYTLLVLGIFKLIPVTLTLAGIAGFILSIGMAVDANILIFERIKEELRTGRMIGSAIELGFVKAWSSIRDSNASTLITSAILYKFGTGIVRGFAVTLAIGVLVSMFSAIVVTRTFIRVFYKR